MLIALFTSITPASAAAAAANILPIKTKWESKFRASPTVRWTSAWGNQSWGGGSGFIDNSSIWNPNRSGCGCGCCNHLHTCPKATLPHAAAGHQAQRSRSHSRIPGRLAGATFCLIELAKKKKKKIVANGISCCTCNSKSCSTCHGQQAFKYLSLPLSPASSLSLYLCTSLYLCPSTLSPTSAFFFRDGAKLSASLHCPTRFVFALCYS